MQVVVDWITSFCELDDGAFAIDVFEAPNVWVDLAIRQHVPLQIIDPVSDLLDTLTTTVLILLETEFIIVLLFLAIQHFLVVGVHILQFLRLEG